MIALFPQTTDYHISKLSAGESASLALVNIDFLSENLRKFKTSLEKRGYLGKADNGIGHEIGEGEYVLAELKKFHSRTSDRLTDRDTWIFTHYLQRIFRNLGQIAKEIDHEYLLENSSRN